MTVPARCPYCGDPLPPNPWVHTDTHSSPYQNPTAPPGVARPISTAPGVETRQVLLVLGAACLTGALATGTALVWHALGASGQAALMVGVTTALILAAVRLTRLPATSQTLCAVGVMGLLIDAVAARSLGVAGIRAMPLHVYAGMAATSVAVVLATLSLGVQRFWSPPIGAGVATITAAIAWVRPDSIDRVAWMGPLVIAATAALDATLRRVGRVGVPGRIVTASVASVVVTVAFGGSLVAATRHADGAVAGIVIAAALFMVPEFLQDRSRDIAWVTAAAAGAVAGAVGVARWADAAAPTRATMVVSIAAAAVLLAAFRARGVLERAQLAAIVAGAAAVLGLYGSMTDRTTSFGITNLLLAAVAASVAVGWPRTRGEQLVVRAAAAVTGVVLATIGATLELEMAHATTPELYVVAPGLGVLLLGAAAMSVWPGTPSWLLAPGIVTALLPTLLLALGHDTRRQVAVLCAGAALVVVGSQLRFAAPLGIGAVAVSLIVVRVAGPQVGRLPHWVSLGVVGAVLLALGGTWEARMLDMRRASHALRPRIAALR